jgi:SAM-dependent methyltransferase
MTGRLYKAVGAAYDALWQAWSRAVIDRILGVETAGRIDLATLGVEAPGRVSYGPGGWLDLRRLVRPDEVREDDVFLDLGAGLGRTVLMAARYPFARVIGVELSERLTARAQRNVAACRLRPRCGDIEVVNADIVDYRVPDDVSVVYLFNPVRGPLFDVAVQQLIESVDRRPRHIRLIYRNPVEHERLMQTGRFRMVRRSRAPRPTRAWREKAAIRSYLLEPAG